MPLDFLAPDDPYAQPQAADPAPVATPGPISESDAVLDAQDTSGVYGPGEYADVNKIGEENGDVYSYLDKLGGGVSPVARGPGAAIQYDYSALERAAPGTTGAIDSSSQRAIGATENLAKLEEQENSQMASVYGDTRKRIDQMNAKSMADYEARKQKMDEHLPQLEAAADRIAALNFKNNSFWGSAENAIAYQTMMAMHAVSDDHVGIQTAANKMIESQINRERLQLDRARSTYDALQSTLGQYRALAGDAQIGDQLYRKSALEVSALQLEELSKSFRSQSAKDAGVKAAEALRMEAQKLKTGLQLQTYQKATMANPALAKYNNQVTGAEVAGVDPATARAMILAQKLVEKVGPERAAKVMVQSGAAKPEVAKAAVAQVTASKAAPTSEKKDFVSDRPTEHGAKKAIDSAESRFRSAGREREIPEFRSTLRKAVGEIDSSQQAGEVVDTYNNARAVHAELSSIDAKLGKASKATGIPKTELQAAFLSKGRKGMVEALMGKNAAKLDPGILTSRLKEAGIMDERTPEPSVLIQEANKMRMMEAKQFLGTFSEGDKKTLAEMSSGGYGTFNEMLADTARMSQGARMAAKRVAGGIFRKSLSGPASQALTGQEVDALVEDHLTAAAERRLRGVKKSMGGK